MKEQELGLFNMASKPTRRSILLDMVKPNSHVADGGRLDGGEYPSTEKENTTSTTSEVKTQVEKHQRHGRSGDKEFSCSFCGDHNHRSGDCRMRLEKLLGQAARGLMRVESENFVFKKMTEILEKAKAKQAEKNKRKSSKQQQRTAGKAPKPATEIGDKGAGDATATQTAAEKKHEEERKKAAAKQQEEDESRLAAKKEERKSRRKQRRREIRTTAHERHRQELKTLLEEGKETRAERKRLAAQYK